jgi:hypothetical protein
MNRIFLGITWIYDIIRLVMRSSFVSALREEKLRSTEIQHIMYSQSNSSSVTQCLYVQKLKKPILHVSNNIPVPVHHSLWHFPSLAQKRLSPDISSSERKHTPLNKAGCTLKLKSHMWEIFRHVLQVSCSETCTNNKQGKRNNFRISEWKQTR